MSECVCERADEGMPALALAPARADPNQEMTAKSGNVNNILRVVAPVSGPAL